ncbi:sterol desaturase family protein [Archangium violaceum]|uniref:sterol desaturase family protein n=1 Tax=Archangium violaceum TaxID=83451 RepID=UPI00193C592F|nr:sterol desaturase family protein [Archangium violaceum]QRK04032.1 sterol desaturase family protein [Archangium violaceum]
MHLALEAFIERYQFLLMLAVLVPLLVLETYRPLATGRRGRLVHGLRHVGLFALGTVVFGFIVAFTSTLAVSAAERHFGLLNLVSLPGFAQVFLGLLAIDLVHYGRHLLMHKVSLLWRLHRVHHSDPDVDTTTLFRVHPLENLSVFICQLLAVALFGVPLLSLLLHSVLNTASAMLQHANIRLPAWADRWMSLVLTSPGMHHVHHSRYVEETDTNYGAIFAWWDRLFGTYRMPPEDRDIELGLPEFDEPRYQSFRGLMVTPFITPEAPRTAPRTSTPGVFPMR